MVNADPLANLFEEDIDSEGDWSEVLGDLRDGGGAVSGGTAFSSSLALVPSSRPGATPMDPFTCTLIQSSPIPPPLPSLTYPPSPSPTHLSPLPLLHSPIPPPPPSLTYPPSPSPTHLSPLPFPPPLTYPPSPLPLPHSPIPPPPRSLTPLPPPPLTCRS